MNFLFLGVASKAAAASHASKSNKQNFLASSPSLSLVTSLPRGRRGFGGKDPRHKIQRFGGKFLPSSAAKIWREDVRGIIHPISSYRHFSFSFQFN